MNCWLVPMPGMSVCQLNRDRSAALRPTCAWRVSGCCPARLGVMPWPKDFRTSQACAQRSASGKRNNAARRLQPNIFVAPDAKTSRNWPKPEWPTKLRILAEDRKAANAGSGAPDLAELYDEATGLPYKAVWNPATGEFERVGGVKAASGMSITTNPDGTVGVTQGAGMKPLTEGQSKDAGFAMRAAGALPIIDQYDEALTKLPQSFAGSAPVVGNLFKSENFQKAEQAGTEFLLTILRKEASRP